MRTVPAMLRVVSLVFSLVRDAVRFVLLRTRSCVSLRAENLFLRKRLTLNLERKTKSRRANEATRLTLALLSKLFAWKEALVIVKPETLINWPRNGFRLFRGWKAKRRGRPRIPVNPRNLIVEMARSNLTWGEERIAAELRLKVGIRVSPRTVRRYVPGSRGYGSGPTSQHWMTFVRNHAQVLLACDYFFAITAKFRSLYVFVIMEVGTRRIAHVNVIAHPSAWTLQQIREVIIGEHRQRFLIYDRGSIYSSALDSALQTMDLMILKTTYRAPQENAFCERLIGTVRRECLDFLIPLNERHLRGILQEWVTHFNSGRPHSSLGPGMPDPVFGHQRVESHGHSIPIDHHFMVNATLGTLHCECRLERRVA
jgi:putative transposase